MKTTLTTLALLASAMAQCPAPSATPTPTPTPSPTPDSPYFTVMSARSASPIHFQQLTARGGKFFLGGGPPSAYCPEQVGSACPAGTTTTLAGGEGTLGMGVIVPGGQQVYIAPDGTLSYTQAHSAYIPTGSRVDGFSRDAPVNGQSFGYLNFDTGFVACPPATGSEGNGWQVYGQVENAKLGEGCLGFSALAVGADAPGAWQY